MEPIIVEVRSYNFYLENQEESKEYQELRKVLSSVYKCFNVWPTHDSKVPAGKYEIDTGTVFENQYNATCLDSKERKGDGFRIFDWFEEAVHNRNVKKGYYIKPFTGGRKQLDEFKRQRFVCGFCGTQYDDPEIDFCTKCRDSKYLTPDRYMLLKLRCVAHNQLSTHSEFYDAVVIPDGVLADIEAKQKKRALKDIEDDLIRRIKELEKKRECATVEADLLRYLVHHGYTDMGNMILYAHKNEFCFGWRVLVRKEEATLLHKLMPRYLKYRDGFTYKVLTEPKGDH